MCCWKEGDDRAWGEQIGIEAMAGGRGGERRSTVGWVGLREGWERGDRPGGWVGLGCGREVEDRKESDSS